jgi:hypothetical protein
MSLARRLVERCVFGMNHDENIVHGWMRRESGDGPRQNRDSADRTILLGTAVLACCPGTAAGGNNQRRNTHKPALPKDLTLTTRKLLHCGKSSVARQLNPSYGAQLKIMGPTCIKIVHPRSKRQMTSKGYTA